MANYKKRLTGFHETIIKNTEVDNCKDNIIVFTIDSDNKHINYTLNKKTLKNYIKKIYPLLKNDIIIKKEVISLLEDDIYSIYKTKVAMQRIPQIILNIFVIWNILDTDDGIDYTCLNKNIQIEDIYKNI